MKNISLLLLFLFFYNDGFSQGFAGGGIRYEVKSNGLVQLNYDLLIDCKACFKGCEDLTMYVSSSQNIYAVNLKMDTTIDITDTLSEHNCSPCKDSDCNLIIGFKKVIFSGQVDLSNELANQECNIEANIELPSFSNVNFAKNSSKISQKLKFNLCKAKKSPIVASPLIFVPVGIEDSFDPRIISENTLDIYAVEITDNNKNAIQYNANYSAKKPFRIIGDLAINNKNGQITFKSMQIEKSILRMQINETNAGEIISISEFDFAFYSYHKSVNDTPTISGYDCKPPTPTNFEISISEGEQLCFNICTSDRNLSDSVSINWNNGIKDASFNTLNPGDKREKAQFCWTPKKGDAINSPYYFTVTASDNARSTPNTSTKTFKINVLEHIDFEYKITKLACGKVQLDLNITSQTNVFAKQWFISIDNNLKVFESNGSKKQTIILDVFKQGEYPITITAYGSNGHNAVKYDTIQISSNDAPPILSKYQFQKYCIDEEVEMDITNFINPGAKIKWLDNNSTNLIRKIGKTQIDKNYYIEAKLGTCIDTLTFFTNIIQLEPEKFTSTSINRDAPSEIRFNYPSNDDAKEVIWEMGDSANTKITGKIVRFTYNKPGSYHIVITASNDHCSKTHVAKNYVNVFPTSINDVEDELNLHIYPNPASNYLSLESDNSYKNYTIFDLNGKLISKGVIKHSIQQVDVKTLSNGTYILQVSDQNNQTERALFNIIK